MSVRSSGEPSPGGLGPGPGDVLRRGHVGAALRVPRVEQAAAPAAGRAFMRKPSPVDRPIDGPRATGRRPRPGRPRRSRPGRPRPPAREGRTRPAAASPGRRPPGRAGGRARGRTPGAPGDAAERRGGGLLGLEGQAASLYFGEFGRMLKNQKPGRPFDFRTGNRRPPKNPVNALLSFAYAILAKDCFSAACTVGFDPYQGFYHAGRHGRPSPALDFMEEFRSIIADSVVITLVNNGTVAEGDFLVWRESCGLTAEGRKAFFGAYEARKATVVTHPLYGYTMSYGRMLEVQARMLAAFVRCDVPSYPGSTVRRHRRPEAAPQGRPALPGLRATETIFSVFLSTSRDRPGKTPKSPRRDDRPGPRPGPVHPPMQAMRRPGRVPRPSDRAP